MIKSILGGKSKNLFDISKFIDTNSVKRIGNTLVCSSYGTSIGTLGTLCPTLKASDTITISFKCTSQGVASKFMNIGGDHIFYSGSTFIASELGLSSPVYLYNTDWAHRDIPNKTTYSDIQLEKGSTATEYVPHELTSYKSIMKVSDVCQLMDKNKFMPSHTDRTLTFTNNGDGSVTVSGVIVNTSRCIYDISNLKKLVKGYKYLLSGCPKGVYDNFLSLNVYNNDNELLAMYYDTGSGLIFTFDQEYYNRGIGGIYIYERQAGAEVNRTYTPQLFNLTEMFGAGNEPKTVAEFKAKFPNDYYPYSPSCFVTSFDERMPCKTKNLFSSSTEVGIPSSTGFDRSEKRLMEDGKWYIGLTGSNYYSRDTVLDYSITENSVYVKWISNGYGVSKCIYCEPNTTYSFTKKYSLIQGQSLSINVGFYTEDGTFISFKGETATPHFVFTTPENCKYIAICISGTKFPNDKFGAGCFSDLQLVKGTTATDYVPYRYV